MTLARQPAVLTQACRALGALALLPQNRTRIAAAGGIGALVKLLAAARPPPLASGADAFTENSNTERREDLRVTETVQETALAALTNLTRSCLCPSISHIYSSQKNLGNHQKQTDS